MGIRNRTKQGASLMNCPKTLIVIMLTALSAPASSETVLETDDNVATLTGSWAPATAPAGYYGSDYAIATAGGATDTARFASLRPITTSGTWCVQARWIAGGNRSTAARYQIFDGAASRGTFTVNQKIDGGAWRRLGCVALTAGNTSEVRLSDTGSAAGTVVVADAVLWVWEESSAQNYCIAMNGGFGSGGTTFIGRGFSVPTAGNCKPWSGFTKTAGSVIATSTGTGCTSSDGKVLTVTAFSTNPSWFGPGGFGSDHIQLCPGGAAGCPIGSGVDSGSFGGPAAPTACTSGLLDLPAIHD
jgi:hypothetical protein